MNAPNMSARIMSARMMSAHITSAHIIARLASLAARLRAAFRQSRMRLCRRVAHHGLAAID
jgi:hypothetical protein